MRPYLLLTAFSLSATLCLGQMAAVDTYMENPDVCEVAQLPPGSRTEKAIKDLLPLRLSNRFAEYAIARSKENVFSALRSDIEGLRLNKFVGATSGGSGTTSLLSKVATPALLGFATEYGGIVQSNNGSTSTLRGNLFGISRMFVGAVRYPSCQPALGFLEHFSGAISFENVSSTQSKGTAQTAAGTTPVAADLFGNDFRMASWSGRFDITRNNPDASAYVTAWTAAIDKLRGGAQVTELAAAVSGLFGASDSGYVDWETETIPILKDATNLADFRQKLAERLDILIDRMSTAHADFATRITRLSTAFLDYASVRDALLKEIQSNKLSLEYTNQHPRGQANTSNIRFIYSHQPGSGPLVVTANAAFTWYNAVPAGVQTGRFRDVQIAGQIDRRLGQIPTLGNAIATFAGYYQWMRDDALIIIGPGNVAPGNGIVLPGTAATLLGTKGSIGIVQGKLSIPIANAVKVPISVTWSNRTELIKESDIRGQIGLTLDLDAVFKK
jgi:hypothetical protein